MKIYKVDVTYKKGQSQYVVTAELWWNHLNKALSEDEKVVEYGYTEIGEIKDGEEIKF